MENLPAIQKSNQVPDLEGRDLKVPSRTEVQRQSAKDIIAAGADEVFGSLFEVLGITPIDDVHPLELSEINQLTSELLVVRLAQDMITGRADALKKYATEVINLNLSLDGKDSSTESGELFSPEFNVRLSKEVTGNKLVVDVEKLEQILSREQFISVVNYVETVINTRYPDGTVTTETRNEKILNEEALEREIQSGNIGMEQVVQSTTTGKSRTAFYVRTTK